MPTNIDIRIKDWHGVTQDGSNEEELVQSLTEHINRERTYELSKKKWIPASITVGVIAVIAAFLLSNLHIIASVVVLGLAGYKIYKLNKDYKDSINKINREYDEYLEKSLTVLRGILAEVVDYRSFYAEKDSDYNRVIDFLNSISSATLTN